MNKYIILLCLLLLSSCFIMPVDKVYVGENPIDDNRTCWWYVDYYSQQHCSIGKKGDDPFNKKGEFNYQIPTNKPKYYKNDSFKKCNSCDEYIKKYKKR